MAGLHLGITVIGVACEIAPVLTWDNTVGEDRRADLRMFFGDGICEEVMSIYYSFTDTCTIKYSLLGDKRTFLFRRHNRQHYS